jgi:hypothetical protein
MATACQRMECTQPRAVSTAAAQPATRRHVWRPMARRGSTNHQNRGAVARRQAAAIVACHRAEFCKKNRDGVPNPSSDFFIRKKIGAGGWPFHFLNSLEKKLSRPPSRRGIFHRDPGRTRARGAFTRRVSSRGALPSRSHPVPRVRRKQHHYARANRDNSRAADVGCHEPPRGVRMSRRFNSPAMSRTLVIPWSRISSMMA